MYIVLNKQYIIHFKQYNIHTDSDKASCVYCRNPNSNSRGPWCYTDGLGERESCRVLIPKCGEYRIM